MKTILLFTLFLMSPDIYSNCSLTDKKCCLEAAHFKILSEMGRNNRRRFGTGDIYVSRWSDERAEKKTLKAFKRSSSLKDKDDFFLNYKRGYTESSKAGSGIYVVLPFPRDPDRYHQLKSSNTYAMETNPSSFFIKIGGPNLQIIEESDDFSRFLLTVPGYNLGMSQIGDIWQHFRQYCADRLSENAVFLYSSSEFNWAVIKGKNAIVGAEPFEQVVPCSSLKNILARGTDFSQPAKNFLQAQWGKRCEK